MIDLCERLQNVHEAGVYLLNCPLDDLRASAKKSGFAVFEANIKDANGKGEVLAEMARAIAAPDWFGHNWDALADALGDLSWRPASGYVLLLHGEPSSECYIGRHSQRHNVVLEIAGKSILGVHCVMPTYKQPISALIVIYTSALDVLLLERADFPGYWQSVTGSRDDDESLRADRDTRSGRRDRIGCKSL